MLQPERIRTLRRNLSYNQSAVAQQLNTTRETYANYEIGRRQPSAEMLVLMSHTFHTNIEYILGESDLPYSISELSERDLFVIDEYFRTDDGYRDLAFRIMKLSEEQRLLKSVSSPNHNTRFRGSDL